MRRRDQDHRERMREEADLRVNKQVLDRAIKRLRHAVRSAPKTKTDGDISALDPLFARVCQTTGEEYTAARDGLLGHGEAVIRFLKDKQTSAATEQERWLAEIMLARAEHPQEMREIEQLFSEKARLATARPKHTTSHAGTRSLPTAFLLPDEQFHVPPTPPGFPPQPADAGKRANLFRITDSPLWRDLAGEILMKGPVLGLEDLTSTLPHSNFGSEVFADNTTWAERNSQVYTYLAFRLLTKMRETRAGPYIVAILQDKRTGLAQRSRAIEALRELRYGPAQEALLDLAEAKGETETRARAADAVGVVGDISAIPRLEEISARARMEGYKNISKAARFAAVEIRRRHSQGARDVGGDDGDARQQRE